MVGYYPVLGIGGPILDVVLPVSEEYLATIPGKKGGMEPLDYESLQKIVRESGSKPHIALGGSAQNTLQGMARFGERCALLGMIGKDETAQTYRQLLHEQGIHSILIESETPSAIVLSMVTPDGERTMRTFQGASKEIRGEHLKSSFFEKTQLVHLEGYMLFNDNLIETAMYYAQEQGAKISFDLASFEIVQKFHSKILRLLEDYVDIIFCNEREAFALTESSEEKTCDFLAEICEVGVVLMGDKGCWVKKGDHKVYCPAYPVKPLDTTGAGDLFASGFLHAYLQDLNIQECAHYGAIAGRAVVQVMGAAIPSHEWEEIYKSLLKKKP